MSHIPPYLLFQNVAKSYGPIQALKSFNLTALPGERIAILGANGAGKSTFLGLASGLRQPDHGEVSLFGLSPTSHAARRRFRILPQDLAFPSQLRVSEILKVVYAHFSESDFLEGVRQVGLERLLDRRTSELSGGERRKLGVVASLAGTPDLLLLDEPTANVDLEGQALLRDLFLNYLSEGSRTLIFSSHRMQEVEDLADRIVVLREGQIVAQGSVQEIKLRFGLLKVRYRWGKVVPQYESAKYISTLEDRVELVGHSSDAMIREILAYDPLASGIEIVQPSLEEVLFRLWQGGELR